MFNIFRKKKANSTSMQSVDQVQNTEKQVEKPKKQSDNKSLSSSSSSSSSPPPPPLPRSKEIKDIPYSLANYGKARLSRLGIEDLLLLVKERNITLDQDILSLKGEEQKKVMLVELLLSWKDGQKREGIPTDDEKKNKIANGEKTLKKPIAGVDIPKSKDTLPPKEKNLTENDQSQHETKKLTKEKSMELGKSEILENPQSGQDKQHLKSKVPSIPYDLQNYGKSRLNRLTLSELYELL